MSDIRNNLTPDINIDTKNGLSTESADKDYGLQSSVPLSGRDVSLLESSSTISVLEGEPLSSTTTTSTASLSTITTATTTTGETFSSSKPINSIDLLAEFDPLCDSNTDKKNSISNEAKSKAVDDNECHTSGPETAFEKLSINEPAVASNRNDDGNGRNIPITNPSQSDSIPRGSSSPEQQQQQAQSPPPPSSTTPPTAVPTPAANTPLPESDSYGNLAQEYQLKWIIWKGGERYPIVTQNSNGPCPLLAIINVLLLRKSIIIPPMYEIITASQLMDYLCDSILNSVPSNIVDEEKVNYEQNFQDAMAVLPKLATGLDVNVRFSDVDQFEYTQESIIFDLLNIPLVHGWLSDPGDEEIHRIVGNSSYNQLIDRIITSKGPNGDCNCAEMLLAEEFLNNSASQLTHYGLFRLQQFIKEDELAIFFRNNHFITLYKRNNQLYQLATDQGFLSEPNVVWETLNSIEGNTHFVDSNFVIVPPKESFTDLTPVLDMTSQVDQDHLLALSLAREQELSASQDDNPQQTNLYNIQSDEEFARQLQAEEEKAYENYRQQQLKQQEQQQQQQQQQKNMRQQQQRPGSASSSSSTSHQSQRLNQPTLSPNQQNHTRAEQQAQQQQAQSQHRHHHHQHQAQHRQSSINQSTSRASLRNSRQSPSPSERSSKSSRCLTPNNATRENIQVAIRIRPRLPKDIEAKSGVITNVTPGEPQVSLNQHSFTFDHVFDVDSKQDQIYETVVRSLVDGCFDGFNATIFAYGQTGSGKTHTMGTCFDLDVPESERGIIPRALDHFFTCMQDRRQSAIDNQLPPPEFSMTAQFIEIYNEELRDLLCGLEKQGTKTIHIVEDAKNGIVLNGATNKPVKCVDEALDILKRGSLFRTTGATRMNSVSSRSHAIFTLFIHQNRFERGQDKDGENCETGDWVRISAKFNFVDLAGSERLSRTGAEGERMREGIKINCGLLHLGNVISKLGDPSQKNSFVNYRDSKLTRILQDSLGGNSVTTMIACISPCDFDFVETLNTLRYANRAKNIKNKAVANQDSNSQLISELKKRVAQLEFENDELRQGKMMVNEVGDVEHSDLYLELQMLKRENELLTAKNKTLAQRYDVINHENIRLNAKIKASELTDGDSTEELVKGYLEDIARLELKLQESENIRNYYQSRYVNGTSPDEDDDCPSTKAQLKLIRDRLEVFNQSMNFAPKEEDSDCSDSDDNSDDDSDQDEKKELIREEHETSMEIQGAQLANLISMIESKEKQINEHEERNQKYRDLAENYEKKILQFKQQIREIEKERDALIKKMTDENMTKRIKEMEKQVDSLNKELKRYERLKSQHDKLIRNESKFKEEVKKMRQEVIEAKARRIQIIQEMKKAQYNFQKQAHKQKLELNRLLNHDVKKNLQINNLQAESRQQKAMIKRKNEEIVNLKRRNMENGRSMQNINKTPRQRKRMLPLQTPQKVRKTWNQFEKRLDEYVKNKLQFEYEEKKLNNYFKQKEDCIRLLQDVSDDHEYIEDLKQNLDFIQKNIEDCQNVIVGLDTEEINWESLYSGFTPEEVGYFLNKLTQSSLNYAILSWQREEIINHKDNIIKEQLMEIHRMKIHRDLLNSLINSDGDVQKRLSNGNNTTKRRIMCPEELLYSIEKHQESVRNSEGSDDSIENDKSEQENKPLDQTFVTNNRRALKNALNPANDSYNLSNAPTKKNDKVVEVKLITTPNGENDNSQPQNCMPPPSIQSLLSPRLTRRKFRNLHHSMLPVLDSNFTSSNNNPNGLKSQIVRSSSINNGHSTNGLQNGKDGHSPYASPVFPRHSNKLHYSKSNLVDYNRSITTTTKTENFPLLCTYEIYAHGRPILSICSTEDYVISGSRDCIAKIWDVQSGALSQEFSDHSDIVNVVRFHNINKQLFAVSNTVIKIWDPRAGGSSLVKMISPSGISLSTDYSSNQGITIDDIQISQCGNYLYYTCDRMVKVCDLRNYQNVAKFNSGHLSKITCIALAENSDFSTVLATGSKDHNVKLFDVENPPSGNNTPRLVLKPPHYDGVETLKLAKNGSILFSGGRDGYIKKYDLQTEKLNSNFGNYSNGVYVCSLDLMLNESVLVSGYRNGVLKLWSAENSQTLGETLAHPNSELRTISTNSKHCFTAGSEGMIKFWTVPDDAPLNFN